MAIQNFCSNVLSVLLCGDDTLLTLDAELLVYTSGTTVFDNAIFFQKRNPEVQDLQPRKTAGSRRFSMISCRTTEHNIHTDCFQAPLTDANQRWNSGEQCLTWLKEGTRGTIGKFNTRSSYDSIKFVLNKTLRILEVLGV